MIEVENDSYRILRLEDIKGKTIEDVGIRNNVLTLVFDDGTFAQLHWSEVDSEYTIKILETKMELEDKNV